MISLFVFILAQIAGNYREWCAPFNVLLFCLFLSLAPKVMFFFQNI